jgi:hypothetical protein
VSTWNAEQWLSERLQRHGVDIYADGPFTTLCERFAHAIVSFQCADDLAGRRDGRIESFGQVFERIYGLKPNDVPRGTPLNNSTQQSTQGRKRELTP